MKSIATTGIWPWLQLAAVVIGGKNGAEILHTRIRPFGVRRTTTKHHITDAELICLRGYDKSIVAQAQTLARLNNQKPDEVVERYLSTATAIYQQTQCVK